jgi:hypothetical protein
MAWRHRQAGARKGGCNAARGAAPSEVTPSGATCASHPPAALREAVGAGWCRGPLRAPPPGANHAVPVAAVARGQLRRPLRSRHRSRTAAEHPWTGSTPLSAAASWRTASRGCAAGSAATTSCWPTAASAAGFARHVARAACRRPRRSRSTTPWRCRQGVRQAQTVPRTVCVRAHSRACRCGSGCCRRRSRCAGCWPRSPSW